MLRKPTFAGSFYYSDPKILKVKVEKLIGTVKSKKGRDIIAAIVPHAGYEYSGYVAGKIYAELSRSPAPQTVILIGPNHNAIGSSIALYHEGEWETPLGRVEVDKEFSALIMKKSRIIYPDQNAHLTEHSLEVQLPFLQTIYSNFKIVPILMKGINIIKESNELMGAILDASYELGRKIVVIASSDFTHYGTSYMYSPYKANAISQVEKQDKKSIEFIEKLNEVNFLKEVAEKNLSYCGYVPIVCAIIYARSLKCKKGELMNYDTSSSHGGDKENFVTYAGIVFEVKK